jgi:hypothetical protein
MKFCVLMSLLCGLSFLRAEDITPRVGLIEIYGAHHVSENKILKAIALKPGDPMPSRGELEDALTRVPGVTASRVEAVCCLNSAPILYIGVEERGEPHIEYHPEPGGDITLPAGIQEKYNALLDATAASLRGHNADEDLTNGYSLMADPEARQLQKDLLPLVATDLGRIHKVLHESADPEERAAAAYVLQYGPRVLPADSKIVGDDLQYALSDIDDNVRRNAILAIKAVLVGAALHPDQRIRIEPTWFIELLNSAVWSDRRNAALALLTLTEKRDPETMRLIRQRALPSVVEMARWHDLEHALPGFLLAGRLAGLSDDEIRNAWSSGDHEEVIKRALKGPRKS